MNFSYQNRSDFLDFHGFSIAMAIFLRLGIATPSSPVKVPNPFAMALICSEMPPAGRGVSHG